MVVSLTFNVLDQKPHLFIQLINGPSEGGSVAGDKTEEQNSYKMCDVCATYRELKLIIYKIDLLMM